MKKGVKKCLLITVCIVNFQMCMFSYATACESTPNIKVNRSKSRNVYMKIISATPKTIKIKIFNKSENIARYSESFTLYKYKDGKYKKIKKALKIQGFSYYNITSLQMCPPAKPVWVPPQLHRLPGLPPGQLLRSIARSGRQLGVHLYLVVPQAVQGVPPHWHLLALGMVYPGH